MAIKLVDELKAMGNFPIAHAEGINLVKTDGTEDNLQNLFDNGELGGGDSSVTLTQSEYEALTEEQKLDGLYYTYDTKRIYKNGIQYGASELIPLTMEEYKALKEAGAIDEQQEYLIEANEQGILLGAEDIGYNNAESGIQATTVQGAIDELNSNLVGLSDNINGFKNVQIVSALGSTKLKEIIQSEFPKLQNGRGMIKISDGTTLYCGIYIKYSNTQGSATFTNVEGNSYIWTIKGDTVTLQELATMDKVVKYPDWSNQQTISHTEITVDQDVYIELNQLNSFPIEDLKINGKKVSVSDVENGLYSTRFSGYVKKGSFVSYPYLTNANIVRVFPLV